MVQQLPLSTTFIVSIWLEALVYGVFLCLFCASIYINVSLRKMQDRHSRIMFASGVVMFIIATMHLGMNCFRLIRGFVDNVNGPGGATAYIGDLRRWDHIFKDTLYATQEILGDAVAIYRCWILWNRSYKVVVLPCVMLVASIVSGYTVCSLYKTIQPGVSIFNPTFESWIKAFYSLAVVQNLITTGLLGYRIWSTDRRTAHTRASKGNLLPVLRILVESAALQVVVEILLLALYAANINAQYILLEIVTPLVGITFSAITIRIALHTTGRFNSQATLSSSTGGRIPSNPKETIGSVPMRRMAVNISKDVEVESFHDLPKAQEDTLNERAFTATFQYK